MSLKCVTVIDDEGKIINKSAVDTPSWWEFRYAGRST